jgi:hypothetical protein
MDTKKFVIGYVILVVSLVIILSAVFLIINSVYGFSSFVFSFLIATIIIIIIIIGIGLFVLFYYGISKTPVVQERGYYNVREVRGKEEFSNNIRQSVPKYSLNDIIENENLKK